MELQTIQEQIELALKYFDSKNLALADSKAHYEEANEFKKTKLAICEMLHGGNTQAEITRNAHASKEYQEFLTDLALKRVEYYRLKHEYDAKSSIFEGLRSLNKNLQ